MADLSAIRTMIHRGAPENGEEARAIVEAVVSSRPSVAEDVRNELFSALTEIMVGRLLNAGTFEARARALSIMDEIECAR